MTLQRTDNFVPLTSASPASDSREFRIKIIPQADSAQSFQALEQTAPKEAGSTSVHAGKNCEPQLLLQRDGARITNIRIQCSCGQIMDLACAYDEPPKTS
jgi:hypothetical protein